MMDPASYLLTSNNINLNSLSSLGDNINSLSDFEHSTSDASSGPPGHYGDPFVGVLSYFDQLTGAELAATPTTTPPSSRLPPTLSDTSALSHQQQHHHMHQQHQPHQQQQQHQHHSQHHHNHHNSSSSNSNNSHHHLIHNHHQHSSLLTNSSSLLLNINNFSLDQLVDHGVVCDDDIGHDNGSPAPYLNHHTQLNLSSDPTLMVEDCELNNDDDDDLINGTLTSFVCTDLESESDNGYASAVSDALFTGSSSSLVDCSDSTATTLAAADSYCFKQFSFSDLHYGLVDVGNGTNTKQLATSTSEKRSVLMNLLIYGSDIGAGYTSIRS